MYITKPYDDALQLILDQGVERTNKRTNLKTLAICGLTSRYRINEFFPIVTRRKVWPKSAFAELLWFISGSTNNKDLQKMGVNIWTPWVDKEFETEHGFIEGALGPIYGCQLRYFNGFYGNGDINNENYGVGGFDQLAYIIERIKEDSSCRRILFDLWNPQQMHMMRLPPCHILFEIFIDDSGRMSGMLTQRSCDYLAGGWVNICFYSAFLHMLAQQTGYTPFEFIHCIGDAHIYYNQLDAVKEYFSLPIIDSPKLELNKSKDIYSYKLSDFKLIDFKSGPKITIPVAV